MKYIPNPMTFSTQSWSSLLILNMIFGIADLDPKLGRFGPKIAMCSNFYEIWHLVQIEHANYEYGTWNWWSRPKIIGSGKFCHNTKICSDFYEISLSQQMEYANYE